MSYGTGQGQFSPRGNMWAMIKSLLESKGSINASMQSGSGALQTVKATYDFAVDGGAVGTITLKNSPVIPAGAIILGGIEHGITLPTSGGAATIAIGFGSGAQSALLKAATAIASYVAGVPRELIPKWTSATIFKVTTEGKITITIATAALTAGKFDIHIVYVMGGE